MNAPERIFFPDIQAQIDSRNIRIDGVGVKGLRYPVSICADGKPVPTVAVLSLTVGLAASAKGTHMSRFIELLEAQAGALDQQRFGEMVREMLQKLGAQTGAIEMRFPYFVRKSAPVSGASSQLDYEVCWRGSVSAAGEYGFALQVTVPVTSLCPCSKEISDYGAHNQRSQLMIEAELAEAMAIEELIAIAERSASCEVYSLLKRADEKFVTEAAYDNPKFVEDLVRDVALALNCEPRVRAYTVEAENFESIHNHSAFARIARRRDPHAPGAAPAQRDVRQSPQESAA